jgi:hypothetical protein
MDAHERIKEADRLRIAEHEAAEAAYQRRFSEALKALDPGNDVEKKQEESKKKETGV